MVHHSRLLLLRIVSEIVQSLTVCNVNGFSKDVGDCIKEKGIKISAKMQKVSNIRVKYFVYLFSICVKKSKK